MTEQRLTLRLRSYWDLIRKDNKFPSMQSFSSGAVEDMWPFCLRITVLDDGQRFRYDFMGTELITLYGVNLTDQMVQENTPQFPGMIIHRKLQEMIKKPEPTNNEGQFVTPKGQMIKYRACMLPFGEQEALTHVILGISYRIF